MTDLRFTGWIPIGVSPLAWEGKPALWRDNRDAPVQIREIPVGFSRSSRHCGAIEVAGIDGGNPISDIPDALETARAEIAALTEQRDRAHHRGWDAYRDTLKPRIWAHKGEFNMSDAVEIINRHHYAYYGRSLAALDTEAAAEKGT